MLDTLSQCALSQHYPAQQFAALLSRAGDFRISEHASAFFNDRRWLHFIGGLPSAVQKDRLTTADVIEVLSFLTQLEEGVEGGASGVGPAAMPGGPAGTRVGSAPPRGVASVMGKKLLHILTSSLSRAHTMKTWQFTSANLSSLAEAFCRIGGGPGGKRLPPECRVLLSEIFQQSDWLNGEATAPFRRGFDVAALTVLPRSLAILGIVMPGGMQQAHLSGMKVLVYSLGRGTRIQFFRGFVLLFLLRVVWCRASGGRRRCLSTEAGDGDLCGTASPAIFSSCKSDM